MLRLKNLMSVLQTRNLALGNVFESILLHDVKLNGLRWLDHTLLMANTPPSFSVPFCVPPSWGRSADDVVRWNEEIYNRHRYSGTLTSPWLGFKRPINQLTTYIEGYRSKSGRMVVLFSLNMTLEWLKSFVCGEINSVGWLLSGSFLSSPL